eukprot:8975144-Alexandrium_andersonii.AAC.1
MCIRDRCSPAGSTKAVSTSGAGAAGPDLAKSPCAAGSGSSSGSCAAAWPAAGDGVACERRGGA